MHQRRGEGGITGENLTNIIGSQQGIEFFDESERRQKRQRPSRTIAEAAREIPVFAEADVLVVGGGPAGTAAAIAADLAANSGVQPRALDPRLFQRELLHQGAYLSPATGAAAGAGVSATAAE